jgi:DNA-binding CsgD family transcriptional regulator
VFGFKFMGASLGRRRASPTRGIDKKHRYGRSCRRGDMPIGPPKAVVETARQAEAKRKKAHPDGMGFVLLDASSRQLYVNEEAVSILTYPEYARKHKRFNTFLLNQVRSLLPSQNGFSHSKPSGEVASGQRCYQLHIFPVKSSLGNGRKPAMVILFERNNRGGIDLSQVVQRFHLTPREAEAVEFLLRGLDTKQIASRMDVSPNTAKAFLRSVMIKMGVEHRSGIFAKVLQVGGAMNGDNSRA